MRDSNFNLTFDSQGGTYIADTSAHTGTFCGIYAHTACVISAITCAKWSGATSVTIPQGAFFPFPGSATSVTLASGTATLINA